MVNRVIQGFRPVFISVKFNLFCVQIRQIVYLVSLNWHLVTMVIRIYKTEGNISIFLLRVKIANTIKIKHFRSWSYNHVNQLLYFLCVSYYTVRWPWPSRVGERLSVCLFSWIWFSVIFCIMHYENDTPGSHKNNFFEHFQVGFFSQDSNETGKLFFLIDVLILNFSILHIEWPLYLICSSWWATTFWTPLVYPNLFYKNQSCKID